MLLSQGKKGGGGGDVAWAKDSENGISVKDLSTYSRCVVAVIFSAQGQYIDVR